MGGDRKAAPEALGAVVEREFGRLASGRPLGIGVITAWRRAVGDRVARRALPIRERAGTLTVRVETGPWLTELQMLAPSILERLQSQAGCGRLRALRFEVGPLPRGSGRGAPAPEAGRVGPPTPLPPAVEAALAAIRDEALRDRIARALRAAFTRPSPPRRSGGAVAGP